MDVNESTYTGNISAMSNLLDQGGIGDPGEEAVRAKQRKTHIWEMISVLKYVVLFFGDLATFERVAGVLQHRSIEGTPWR
jgi:hypothetical protein